MPTVNYLDINQTFEVSTNQNLLSVSIDNQIPHLHECGGNARCTTCRIRIVDGHKNLSKPTEREKEMSNNLDWGPSVRLACQCNVIKGDVSIERLLWSSPEITALQLETVPKGVAEEREVAILSCDMRGFTNITSKQMSFDTAHMLDRFYTALGDPILLNNGIIYQYVGDEIIGLFGVGGGDAETQCLNATRAAIGMRFAAERLNRYELSSFDVNLKIGIGITYGKAFLGHLGHPKQRQFAVIGDPMNMASRIQSATKEMTSNIVISDIMYNIMPKDQLTIGQSKELTLAGKTGKALLHEVLGFSKMDTHLELQATLDLIIKNEEEFVAAFYQKLFSTLPEVKVLFKNNMLNQGRLLMHMLVSIVHALSRPGQLKMGLRALGRSHIKYGVKKNHYAVLMEVLLECIQTQLGEEASQNTLKAWREAMGLITGIMKEAYGE